MPRRRSPFIAGLLLLLLVSTLSLLQQWRSEVPAQQQDSAVKEIAMRLSDRGFEVSLRNAPGREAFVQLAQSRREQMKEWIVSDPERALGAAISWSDYAKIPEELRAYFESPFNASATLLVLPACNDPQAGTERLLEWNGGTWKAHVFGRRAGQMTKENTPLSGITLDGLAAVREFPFEPLSPEDAETLDYLPAGNSDPARDFSTGQPLPDSPVTAVAGGKRYHFSNEDSLARFNRSLAELDEHPGPHSGAQVYLADGVDGGGDGFQWDAAGGIAADAASDWTETDKSVFFIRVDFEDYPGDSVSQSQLSTVLNGAVTDSIREMSYGKTSINATVSAEVIRMPQPSTGYLPDNNTLLRNDAISAYELIHGAGALGSYDIVGIHFPGIGMKSGTVTYAGLAGGSRQWLQGTSSSNVIIHEFGHNYGLGHAEFWQTSDGSVAGTGSPVTYGDHFDIMGSGPDPEGHFHIQGKQRLNWLESAQWADIDTNGPGTYRIYPFDREQTTGLLRGLRASKSAAPDPPEYYWLGYRTRIPANPYLQNGAYLLWQRPGYTRSWLLDTSPATGKDDSPIPLGSTYSDQTANLHITPTGSGGSGADAWLDINVQKGPFPGNNPPTAVIDLPATVAARTPVTVSVTAGDPDNDTLAYSWQTGDVSLPGNVSAFPFQWTVGGMYEVSVTVSDMKGLTASDSVTVSVVDPLNNWTAGSLGTPGSADTVAFLNGRFVATGNESAFLSFDGQNWSSTALGANFRSGGIAFGAGYYVIAGYDYDFEASQWTGDIYRSSDASHWEKVPLPVTGELRDIAFGDGTFVAVGDDGLLIKSTDAGATWTPAAAPEPANLRSIAFGNGTFVTVGGDSIFTSVDGTNWEDRSSGSPLSSWQSLRAITFSNGAFLAGGWRTGIITSVDNGVTWTASIVAGDEDYDIQAFANAGDVLIAISALPDSTFLVSADHGAAWMESNYESFPSTSSAAYGGGVFLTVSEGGATASSDTLIPSNSTPTATINAPSALAARTNAAFSIAANDTEGDDLLVIWDFDDGSPLIDGSSSVHQFNTAGTYSVTATVTDQRGGVLTLTRELTVTDPLAYWTKRDSGTTEDLKDIAFGGGKLVAVGSNRGYHSVSTDGITWTSNDIANNLNLNGIIHDGTRFVAVGFEYDFNIPGWVGAVYTSPDAGEWTRRFKSGKRLNDIAFGNGIYVACGNEGTVLRSVDGLTWLSSPLSGVTRNLHGAAFGNDTFVLAGASASAGDAAVFTSPDGITWTDRSAGAGTDSWQGFFDLYFAGDRFLAGGWYTKIRHSTDSGVTFSTTRNTNEDIDAYAHGNGVYLAAGRTPDSSGDDINLISTDGSTWTVAATPPQMQRHSAIFFNNTFITVGDEGSIWQSDEFSAPEAAGGFSAWQAAWFPGLPPKSGPLEDFDNDGIVNLIEYATGTSPLDSGDRITLTPKMEGALLTLTVPKSITATDVNCEIHRSDDLNLWSTDGTVIIQNDHSGLTVGCPAPGEGDSTRFLRAVFTLQQP